MDSFELNKIAGAVLGTMLVVFGIGIVGDMIFATEEPETPGYVIAVAEEPAEGGEQAAEAAEESIAVLLADADPAAGEASARKCASCHTLEEGGANRVGPNLYNVVERPIASVEGFSYSDAMRAHAEEAQTWSFEELNAFITSPRKAVPGTTMGFAGISNAEERANLLAYLRTLSPDPVPLPEAPAGADATAEGAPGETPEGAEPPQPAAGTAEPSPDQPAGAPEGAPVGEEPVEPEQQAQPQEQQQQAQQDQQQQSGASQDTVLVVPPAGGTGAQQVPAEAQQQQAQQAPAETQQAPAETQQGPAEAPADLPPTLALMGEVDSEAGQAEARKCQACHALEEGGGNRVGPPLWGVVNRPVASSEGYSYSEALTAFGQGKEWDFELLDAFVQAPQKLVPGTKMAFPGIRNERDRAELLVYLNSLSDQPAPLPGGAGGGAPGQAR